MTQNYFPKTASTIDVSKALSTSAIEDFLPSACDALNDEQRESIAEIVSTCRLLLEVGNSIYPTVHFGFETCTVSCSITSGSTDDESAMQHVIEYALEKAPDFALFVFSGTKKSNKAASAHYRLETRHGSYKAEFSIYDSPENATRKVLAPVHGWVKDVADKPSFLAGLESLLNSLRAQEGN